MKLLDRIASALFIRDPQEEHLRFFSAECIKLLFDAVRNFGLCAAVGIVGYFIGLHDQSWVGKTLMYFLLLVSLGLVGLNFIFLLSFLTRIKAFQGSSALLLIAFFLLLPIAILAGVAFVLGAFARGVAAGG